MFGHVVWQKSTDVSVVLTAFISRAVMLVSFQNTTWNNIPEDIFNCNAICFKWPLYSHFLYILILFYIGCYFNKYDFTIQSFTYNPLTVINNDHLLHSQKLLSYTQYILSQCSSLFTGFLSRTICFENSATQWRKKNKYTLFNTAVSTTNFFGEERFTITSSDKLTYCNFSHVPDWAILLCGCAVFFFHFRHSQTRQGSHLQLR